MDSIPSLREWKTKVYYLFPMPKLSAICSVPSGTEGAWEQFRKWWSAYIVYIFPLMYQINDGRTGINSVILCLVEYTLL